MKRVTNKIIGWFRWYRDWYWRLKQYRKQVPYIGSLLFLTFILGATVGVVGCFISIVPEVEKLQMDALAIRRGAEANKKEITQQVESIRRLKDKVHKCAEQCFKFVRKAKDDLQEEFRQKRAESLRKLVILEKYTKKLKACRQSVGSCVEHARVLTEQLAVGRKMTEECLQTKKRYYR